MTSDKFRIRNIGFSLKIPRERKIIFSFFLLSQRCLTSLTLSGFSTSTDELGGGGRILLKHLSIILLSRHIQRISSEGFRKGKDGSSIGIEGRGDLWSLVALMISREVFIEGLSTLSLEQV